MKPRAKAWKHRKNVPGTRIRGRRGQELRRKRLIAEPLCRHCAQEGRVTRATVPDHIIPLAFGGLDEDDNIQCLCEQHHSLKSAFERSSGGGVANHPTWVRPSLSPVKIVCGPPCSGKTTYVKKYASPDDLIIDVDAILAKIRPGYEHWSGDLTPALLDRAIRVRNDMLGSLCRVRWPHVWLIVAAPTQDEREWWARQLDGEIVYLNPGVEECKRRAARRGTPGAIEGINQWHSRSVQPWRGPAKRNNIAQGSIDPSPTLGG
ncbi:MAG: AAA family ATPase [Pseudomonadota bacterium]|nr:AAA family ATPase [Pseudomonadota bacterium]